MRKLARNSWWGALLILLLLAPLPIACVNTEWRMPLAISCLFLGGAGVVASGSFGIDRAVLLLAAFVAWASLALVPLPEGIMGLVSAERTGLPPPPGGWSAVPVSVNPGATLERVILLVGLF